MTILYFTRLMLIGWVARILSRNLIWYSEFLHYSEVGCGCGVLVFMSYFDGDVDICEDVR
jgi:hypothetical protein